MPYVNPAATFIVRQFSGTASYEWIGPNQDNPTGTGYYANQLAHYSAANDTTYSIEVHNFSTADAVSGTWTLTSTTKIPLT